MGTLAWIYCVRLETPTVMILSIPQAGEYVTLHGKRNFAAVSKWRILRWSDYPRWPWWARCNHKALNKREARESKKKIWWQSRGWSHRIADFEDEVRGHELRNAVGLWQLKRQRNEFSPRIFRKECILANIFILAQWDQVWRLLTSWMIRQYICVVFKSC